MNSKVKFLGLLAAGLLFWQGTASAELVQGQVLAVNTDDRSLTVQRMQDSGEREEIKLSIPNNAEFRGIQSFDDVEVGDEIRAEANKPALGIGSWEARWIEKGQAGADAAAQSQGMQSSSAQNESDAASRTAGADAGGDAGAQNQAGSAAY